ncbi:hypothetical protein LCGC14_0556770 [marine sediment metagenome]|uniref:VRR-NUC domain-containing protein n=1 Tax=marine sediment metagenome TaxID=412755 RepID=A0A0F9RTF9_9ZZZZ
MVDKQKQGKKNREAGARFERKVRANLEKDGWVVDRWGNNVAIVGSKNPFEWEGMGKLVPAKSTRFRSNTHGFPDFITFKLDSYDPKNLEEDLFHIHGVECKSRGYLTKEEKEKCKWLLDNNIFSKILIASKSKERGKIDYKEI